MWITLLAFLVTISILVVAHEWGHYWVAKRCGVKILRFSIGFGKTLYSWRNKNDVEFVIAALPLGGYVKMQQDSEPDAPPAEYQQAFNNKSLAARTAIVIAGPAANFILAIMAFTGLHLIGTYELVPYVGNVEPYSLAANADLPSGEEIVAVDNEHTSSWQDVYLQLLSRSGDSGTLSITTRKNEQAPTHQVILPITEGVLIKKSPDETLKALGFSLTMAKMRLIIGEIEPGSAAQEVGLQTGDIVESLNDKSVRNWMDLIEITRSNALKPLKLSILRGDQHLQITITPKETVAEDGETKIGHLGIALSKTVWDDERVRRLQRYTPITAFELAIKQTARISVLSLQMMYKMLVGKADVNNLSGPISIAKGAGESVRAGVATYFQFIAWISVSLAVINLLPIPLLDGGHLFYYLIEFVTRRRVPERIQQIGLSIGIFILVGLMMLGLFNDIKNL